MVVVDTSLLPSKYTHISIWLDAEGGENIAPIIFPSHILTTNTHSTLKEAVWIRLGVNVNQYFLS